MCANEVEMVTENDVDEDLESYGGELIKTSSKIAQNIANDWIEDEENLSPIVRKKTLKG